MQAALRQALARRAPAIRARWTDLLRAERASSPLANPEALVHLIDWTLRAILRRLQTPGTRTRPPHPRSGPNPSCPCGRNPLQAHFAAGQQALQEALVLSQAEEAALAPAERDAALEELNGAFRQIAGREMAVFCALCLRRGPAPGASLARRRSRRAAGAR